MLTAFLIIGILLAIILIVIFAFLYAPAILHVKLQNRDLILTLRLFGIPIRLHPKKQKLVKRSPAKAADKPKENQASPFQIPIENAGPEQILNFAKELLLEITHFTKRCTTKVHRLTVVPPKTEDAALAALCHTAVTGGVAAILDLLDKNTRLSIPTREAINIQPNFTNENASVTMHISLTFAPHRALASLVRLTERLQNI